MLESEASEERIDYLKEAYVSGELGEVEFERFLKSAIEGGPPYFYEWFREKLGSEVRHKRYVNDEVYVWGNEEYVVDGRSIVRVEDKDAIDRVIDVQS